MWEPWDVVKKREEERLKKVEEQRNLAKKMQKQREAAKLAKKEKEKKAAIAKEKKDKRQKEANEASEKMFAKAEEQKAKVSVSLNRGFGPAAFRPASGGTPGNAGAGPNFGPKDPSTMLQEAKEKGTPVNPPGNQGAGAAPRPIGGVSLKRGLW
jgi:hypothetical protein